MASIENFGQTIVDARRKAGLTQEALATQLGITAQAISKWENGLGYPDVTLFPEIADALDIPIEKLFGVEYERGSDRDELVSFPSSKDGLDFVFSTSGRACYSSKTVLRVDVEKNIAYFTDGSFADIKERYAVNCGEGEIRFFDSIDAASAYDIGVTELCREFSSFSSLSLSIPVCCDATIKRAMAGERCRVEARGSSIFISRLNVELREDTLYIFFDSGSYDAGNRNKIDIYLPNAGSERIPMLKLQVNGCAKVRTEVDCRILDATVNGSGDIVAGGVNILEAKINGAGDITIDEVAFSANVAINGAGSLKAKQVCTPLFKINGAGEATIDRICGENAVINVGGNGTISLGGEVDTLSLKVSGACDFKSPTLTVREAVLTLSGSSEVEIGRIITRSQEKISKNASLTVHQRGE